MKKDNRLTLYYLNESTRNEILRRLGDLVTRVRDLPERDGRKLVYIFIKD